MVNVNLSIDNVYTIYVKVIYDKDTFFMVGNQFGFNFSYENSYEVLFYDITIRLEEYFAHYYLVNEDIVYVQVSFRLLDIMIYSDLFIDKDILVNMTPTEKKDTLDLFVIPTATTEDGLGKCLPVVLDSNNKIKEVNIVIQDVKYNFLDIIVEKTKYIKNSHRDVITSFHKDYKFYYIKSNIDYILVVKEIDQNKVEIFYKWCLVSISIDNHGHFRDMEELNPIISDLQSKRSTSLQHIPFFFYFIFINSLHSSSYDDDIFKG
jgi:hypothetical protein